ncbi:MAG: UDP-N-acetylglucosamine 2-epimerase (hydrolyzing) [Candidatus Levybacteria bacterium CG10_big_fil_rev_8_21_14_0_10_35_13]|nr:MAG: UDP-N-acetylglucosamine 2-epimerase (hydrolyzing) [Candidatus Levybacteria bacterium CG10_big_fil_rev_8_21_14_0_10_35_13]
MKKKIAYITGTRADFGLMTNVLREIENNGKLSLCIYSTGMHLMKKFGNTVNLVEKEFQNTKRINSIFKSDEKEAVVDFISDLSKGIVNAFSKNKPDFVLTLGDRPEMLSVAMSCLYLRIPSGQLHAGDRTFTVDESARHAITKMSHLFFPATKEAGERIKRMGEEPWRIHVVGAPGLDLIFNSSLPTRKEIFSFLRFSPSQSYILVLQHPVSENIEEANLQIAETLEAVKAFKLPIVLIYPNADPGGRRMIEVLTKEKNNSLLKIFSNIEYKYFLGIQREASVWVGNSSAGMIESSSFKVPVVNVGIRQIGRQHGKNVISVPCKKKEILKAVSKSLNDKAYLKSLESILNPWGDGKTGKRVADILADLIIDDKLMTKQITY